MFTRTPFSIYVLLALIAVGCASTPPVPKAGFVPDQKQGVVVGRAVFVLDGEIVMTDKYSNLLSPSITMHLSPFVSTTELNKNSFVAGKWMVEAEVKSNGYFVATLPPGKYYFVEYMYFDLIPPTGGMAGMRSYTPILGNTLYRPTVATFEVLPGKTTYIGTMRHLYRSVGSGGNWGLEVRDEGVAAKAWLDTNHSQLTPTMEASWVKVEPVN